LKHSRHVTADGEFNAGYEDEFSTIADHNFIAFAVVGDGGR
jgi:hypothetical protein